MIATTEQIRAIKPQRGPQVQFLASPADIAIYGGAAGGGKLLPLDVPIPTPSGMVLMADIKTGDTVFDERGQLCSVTAAYDVQPAPELIRFTFDDGTEIESCVDHQWWTYTAKDLTALTRRNPEWLAARRRKRPSRAGGKKSALFTSAITARKKERAEYYVSPAVAGSVKTTAEIVATLKTGSGRTNHAIPVAAPIETPHVDLPLDPYVLGVWLGDGTRGSGGFTSVHDEISHEIEKAGYTVSHHRDPKSHAILGIIGILRRLGVSRNKHIPAKYLRASRDQRLAILQGILDTDGTVATTSGSVEFCNTNKQLVYDVAELICSLGWKACPREGRAVLNGRDCGPKWTIKFMPSEICFRLHRKANLQKTAARRTTRFRYIVKAEPVASRPGRCISVDSPSRLYLAGRQMVPTHNTYALLIEPLRHIRNPNFSAVIFRQTFPQIASPGGLLDESANIYPELGATLNKMALSWTFPSGATVRFSHLQYEKDKFAWQGAQIPLIEYDELTHFTQSQFFYLMSRNRSMCGVRPYIRGTCNPDAASWVAEFIDWWIDPASGFPISERAGVVRWFVRVGEDIKWAGDYDTLAATYPDLIPKSATFVPSRLEDNPALMRADPGYRANLLALPRVERERLLGGNWRVTERTIVETQWWRTYDLRGSRLAATIGSELVTVDDRQCRRFATIDTAGTSQDRADEARGKPASWSVVAVWDYWAQRRMLCLRHVWRQRVGWNELKARVPGVLQQWNVPRVYIENAHSGAALKDEIRGHQVTLIGPKIDGMAESHRGAKLDRAIASGVLSMIEDGQLLVPSEPSEWKDAYLREWSAWTGLPDETTDQIDVSSYAAHVCNTQLQRWGGIVTAGGLKR
jgi:hypothetical protein